MSWYFFLESLSFGVMYWRRQKGERDGVNVVSSGFFVRKDGNFRALRQNFISHWSWYKAFVVIICFQALMALFVLASKDGWVNIMYTGLDAVGVDQQVLIFLITYFCIFNFFVIIKSKKHYTHLIWFYSNTKPYNCWIIIQQLKTEYSLSLNWWQTNSYGMKFLPSKVLMMTLIV